MTTNSGNLNPMVKLRTCNKAAVARVTADASGQQHTHTQNGKDTLYIHLCL
jgi:hypothetical protein